ncbi:HdeD family acid-resistance protein [Clavibacter michiganensis]|uniref:HdeD family acid-resistance protein n=1 Tax=Clavibacter michiganensis TaxID=28447 RepID=UPI001AE5337E|nr:DUF308 domain-containing protein [Clavibacter michiganensis]MBP2457333.1 uncharacterized membrane protein HdeD (DUF308 family) [Clavibacter michiganensis]MDQ0409903.1 uncharacterized membrane protein HdeD (DUF308 family) [Clavibacter michiganensis]
MIDTALPRTTDRAAIDRGAVIAVGAIAVLLGAIALFLPRAALVTIGVVFGINLLVLGVARVVRAWVAVASGPAVRWATGILGVLVFLAGVLCLVDPFRSLQAIGIIIGVAWILEGVSDVIGTTAGDTGAPRWLGVTVGVVTILAGIVAIFLPVLAVATFVTVGGVILIVIGLATLLAMPRRAEHRAAAA